MKVYISGAISSLPHEEVKEKFRRAERSLREAGMSPVCPLDNGLAASAPWAEHMKADLRMLEGCDAILMLSDWKSSSGAMLEFTQAVRWRKTIIFE